MDQLVITVSKRHVGHELRNDRYNSPVHHLITQVRYGKGPVLKIEQNL